MWLRETCWLGHPSSRGQPMVWRDPEEGSWELWKGPEGRCGLTPGQGCPLWLRPWGSTSLARTNVWPWGTLPRRESSGVQTSARCTQVESGHLRGLRRPQVSVGIYSWDRRHTVVSTPAIEVTRGTVSKVCLRAGDPRGQCSILGMERECY